MPTRAAKPSRTRHTPSKVNPIGGYGRGFQVFDESCLDKHARCINERALGLADGHFGHCRDLAYETVLRTPLVLWIPGVEPGRRREALAENLDLVPTLLDYLGVATAGDGFDGASLRPVIEADRPIRRRSFGMQGVTRTVRDGRYKLIFDLASGGRRLFDLRADPGERFDLSSQRAVEARSLEAGLRRWFESLEGPAASGRSRRRAEEVEKRLRALGYL